MDEDDQQPKRTEQALDEVCNLLGEIRDELRAARESTKEREREYREAMTLYRRTQWIGVIVLAGLVIYLVYIALR